jgi:hypothetical protein
MESHSVDRTAYRIDALSGESDERQYWKSCTPLERLAALELMRQINYGYDPATVRLQRVLEIAKLPRR